MRLAIVLLLVPLLLAGCVGALVAPASVVAQLDAPALLPVAGGFFNRTGDPCYKLPQQTCAYAPFHTLDELYAHILAYPSASPLVRVDTIGASREGRPLYDVVVTNPATPGPKLATLIDGGHHANELEGIEMPLYLVDFLLENYESNATVRRYVDTLEMHFVPLLNPDGYVAGTRGNALGVNLNRNYDIDWGDPYGASNPVMGTLANATGQPMQSVMIVAENCGPYAFSEPETQAMRDLMARLAANATLAFYFTHHTPTNGFIAPWAAGRAPRDIPPEDAAVLETELAWVRAHTEYEAGKAQWGNFSAGLPYSASGSSMDWAYATHHVPAFTLEIAIYYTSAFSDGYVERYYLEPYKGLDYWLRASLPVSLHMLANAEHLARWEPPTEEPALPDGAPPAPPAPGTPLWFPAGDEEVWRPALAARVADLSASR